MPWKECHGVDERARFVARLMDGESMTKGSTMLCASATCLRSLSMKRVLLIFSFGMCIAGCNSTSSSSSFTGPSTSTSRPTGSQTLQSVTLSVNADAMRSRGDTIQATPIGTFADGTSQNVMATCSNWRSDNVSVLTITTGGLITAQGSGASTITTTCQVVADHPPEVTFPVLASTLVTLTLAAQ